MASNETSVVGLYHALAIAAVSFTALMLVKPNSLPISTDVLLADGTQEMRITKRISLFPRSLMGVKALWVVEIPVAPGAELGIRRPAVVFFALTNITQLRTPMTAILYVSQQFTASPAGSFLVHKRHNFPYDVTVAIMHKEVDFHVCLWSGEKNIVFVFGPVCNNLVIWQRVLDARQVFQGDGAWL